MNVLAIVDATGVEAPEGPATVVAGLSLVERTARLAAVSGADDVVVVTRGDADRLRRLIDPSAVDADIHFHTPRAPCEPDFSPQVVVLLDAGAVFERSMVTEAVEEAKTAEPGAIRRTARPHLATLRTDTSTNPQELLEQPRQIIGDAPPRIEGGWIEPIDSAEAVRRAERRLWAGCRKPQDGIVSQHLNRHISLAISRLLAPTRVKPNHITVVTFILGIAAAACAVYGGYFGFLAAGILYQINSVVDGVDGELARVRYEFSVTGEWLDTVADDMADLLMYAGVGIGAWRTMADAPGMFGSELWLVLGVAAAGGKLASMVVYYRWLIAAGRGDLLAFEWSFEQQDDPAESGQLDRVLTAARYLFRKDFIVFAAMVLSFGGYLPHLLFALAPGNVIVAVSVILQQRGRRDSNG